MLYGLVETSRRFIWTAVRASCAVRVQRGGAAAGRTDADRWQCAGNALCRASSLKPKYFLWSCSVDVREVLLDLLWGYCLHRQDSVNTTAYSKAHICATKCDDVADKTRSVYLVLQYTESKHSCCLATITSYVLWLVYSHHHDDRVNKTTVY